MSIPNAPGDDAEPAAASADADEDFDFSRSPHDQFFKSSLRRPEVAADLLAHYLPPEVVALLDLGSLELQDGSFIDDDLRDQQSDLLFRARLLAGGETYIYLVFEHKSSVFRLTPFQILRYQVRIWDGDIRLAGRRAVTLCPIIPIVVYHGQRRWTAPLSLSGLFRSPPALAPFLPEQRYVLLDLQSWKKEEIIGGLLLRVTLLVLQAIFRPNLPFNLTAIAALLRQLGDQVLREQELGRILTYATRAGQGLSVTEFAEVATAADPERGGTIAMTLAEKWLAEGLAEGRVEGRAEGLHVAIEDALHDRFGDAGLALMAQIRLITSSASLRNILRAIHRSTGIDEVRQGLEGLAS